MAEDTTVETGIEPKKDDKKRVAATVDKPVPHDHKPFVLAGLLIVLLLLICGAFVVGHHVRHGDTVFGTERFSSVQLGPDTMRTYTGGFRGDMMQGGGVATSNTRVSGVVTAVDGNNITVAGNGTTAKVTVSSNTTYSGSSEPAKVNDTITAVGAKDGSGTLIASSVYLSRQ